jgi:hypothetical protein
MHLDLHDLAEYGKRRKCAPGGEAFHFRAGIGATQIHVRMVMDVRQVREYLGRVKAYYLKNEALLSMDALISGLKGALTLPGGLPVDVRSPLREAVQLVAKEDLVKKRVPAATPLMYQQGQERQLLAVLTDLRKEIDE